MDTTNISRSFRADRPKHAKSAGSIADWFSRREFYSYHAPKLVQPAVQVEHR